MEPGHADVVRALDALPMSSAVSAASSATRTSAVPADDDEHRFVGRSARGDRSERIASRARRVVRRRRARRATSAAAALGRRARVTSTRPDAVGQPPDDRDHLLGRLAWIRRRPRRSRSGARGDGRDARTRGPRTACVRSRSSAASIVVSPRATASRSATSRTRSMRPRYRRRAGPARRPAPGGRTRPELRAARPRRVDDVDAAGHPRSTTPMRVSRQPSRVASRSSARRGDAGAPYTRARSPRPP